MGGNCNSMHIILIYSCKGPGYMVVNVTDNHGVVVYA